MIVHAYDMWYSPEQVSICGYYLMGVNGVASRKPTWVEIQNVPSIDGDHGECELVLVDGPTIKPLSKLDSKVRLLGPLSHPANK
jgi:hypothetical protein